MNLLEIATMPNPIPIFNTKGIYKLLPKSFINVAIITVYNGDEEADVNSNLVIPQTPCCARFLAIAK